MLFTGPTAWILATPPLAPGTPRTTNPVAGPYDPQVVFGQLGPRRLMTRLLGAPLDGPVSTRLPGLNVDPGRLAYPRVTRPTGSRYLLATGDASSATGYLTAGYSVLPMGGFTAMSPEPDAATLAWLVAGGRPRFVQLSSYGHHPVQPPRAGTGWSATAKW